MEARERQATFADAFWVWWRLRPIDREEAAIVARPIPVLLTMLWGVLFTEVVALHADGVPIALYGVRSLGDGVGLIWMLSTGAVTRHRRDVVDACATYVGRCSRRYRVLFNNVYAKNDTALRLVRRLGFHVGDPFAFRGAVFYPIVRFSCVA